MDYSKFPNSDPYDVGQKYDLDRSQIKDCFTAVLGESSEGGFLSHIRHHDRQNAGFSQKERKRALECLLDAHPLLEGYLFKNISVELQREDSDIALNVLEGLMHLDIAVIPVHESFIVKRKDSHKLKEVMRKAIPSCYIH